MMGVPLRRSPAVGGSVLRRSGALWRAQVMAEDSAMGASMDMRNGVAVVSREGRARETREGSLWRREAEERARVAGGGWFIGRGGRVFHDPGAASHASPSPVPPARRPFVDRRCHTRHRICLSRTY